jgi:TRAP-type C4-dicarboxylate transport system permease small subunit
MYSLGARSQTAQIPMWIPHLAIAAGFGLMVLVALLRLFEKR